MKKKFTLRDLILMGLLSVVFGLLYLGAVYAGAALTTALTPSGYGILGYEPFYGIWFMAALAATYILRRPFVGVLTEVIASVIEVLLGNMFGPIIFISAIIQGLGVELAFGLARYRKYTYGLASLAALFCTVLSFIWTGFRNHYLSLDPKLVLLIFVIRVVSALIFTGLLAPFLCEKLIKAGVLRSDDDAE